MRCGGEFGLIRYYNSAEEIGGRHASSVFFFSLRVGVIPESTLS